MSAALAQLAIGMLITFGLVLTRMAAFMAVSPVPGAWVPARVRIGLAVLLAFLVAPSLPASRVPLGAALLEPMFGELVVGVVIGFVFKLALVSADILGTMLAQALSLTFAASYDPQQATQVDPLTHLVTMLASVIAVATGAHRVVIGALLASVEVLPPGHVAPAGAFTLSLVQWLGRSVEHGFALSIPVVAVCLVVQLAVALVSRAAPQLQIFSVGITITLASGALVLFAGLTDMVAGLALHLASLTQILERVLSVTGTTTGGG
jgi:flagellar biosynthetic protein FliR